MENSQTSLAPFRIEVREFVEANLPEAVRQKVLGRKRLKREDFMSWHRILNDKGWVAPNWPTQFGGAGWDIERQIAFEEECALGGAPDLLAGGLRMVGPILMEFGNDEQRARYLPQILSGDSFWCQGYSEPGAGSDLAALTTSAVETVGGFIVNGHKTWTTQAQWSTHMFCLARTNFEGKPQAGISFLLFPMNAPGISVRPIRTIDGDFEINDVFLEDVFVPTRDVVGEVNQGWTYSQALLKHERFGTARMGQNKLELKLLQEAASSRAVNGVPLDEDPSIAEAIALLEVDCMALEHSNNDLVWRALQGLDRGSAASVLKLIATQFAQQVSSSMAELSGIRALAYVDDVIDGSVIPDESGETSLGWTGSAVAKYLNNRKISIYGGSDEIQKNIIAKHALGL